MPSAWTTAESGKGIDGLFQSLFFTEVLYKCVNGKVKQTKAETADFYNADTGIAMTADERVLIKEYRGAVHLCNGTDNSIFLAMGRLKTAITGASTSLVLEEGNGQWFVNGADKVYVEGDEIDYTAVSTDTLTGATNITASHAVGTIVTQQAAAITPPTSVSLKFSTMEFFRDTMWVASDLSPNVLGYSKTVAGIGTIANIHDFTDNNNYLIGEGSKITALKATRNRLYVFTEQKTYYITTEINSSGVEVFSVDRLFTGNYGCPNPFCVAEMENVVVFFTGKRLIRIGYEPDSLELLPDEKFDEEIFSILSNADNNQANSSLHYNPVSKKLFLTLSVDGILRTVVYNYKTKKYAYPWDHDPSSYVFYNNATFFGDPDDDNVFKFGLEFDGNSTPITHVLKTGRMDGDDPEAKGSRVTKRFIRGSVEGLMRNSNTINFTVFVNGRQSGDVRTITSEHIIAPSSPAGTLGTTVTGGETVGGNIAMENLYEFRYPFIVNAIGEDIQFKWSSLEEGSFWQVDKWHIDGIQYDRSPWRAY